MFSFKLLLISFICCLFFLPISSISYVNPLSIFQSQDTNTDTKHFPIYVKTYYHDNYYYESTCKNHMILNKVNNSACASITGYLGDQLYVKVNCNSESYSSYYDITMYNDINCQNEIYTSYSNSQSRCLYLSYSYHIEAKVSCQITNASLISIIGTIVTIVVIIGFCSVFGFGVRRFYMNRSAQINPAQLFPQTQAYYAQVPQPNYVQATVAYPQATSQPIGMNQPMIQPMIQSTGAIHAFPTASAAVATNMTATTNQASIIQTFPAVAIPVSNQNMPSSVPNSIPSQPNNNNQLYGGFTPQMSMSQQTHNPNNQPVSTGNTYGQYTL